MTQEEMNLLVPQKLDALEKQHDIRVLLAVESGSRAWGFAGRVQPLTEEYFSVKSALYHYLNTAQHHIRDYLLGETVRPKKYFYALRPILACRWALEQKSPPPVLFSRLVEAELPGSLGPAVEHLLELKMHGPEKLEIPPIPEISRYLEASMEELSQVMAKLPEEKPLDWEMLNQFFLAELQS